MPTNNFKVFAGSGGANVVSQIAYETDTAVLNNGYTVGIADPAKINKVLRQSSIMSNVLASTISDITGDDVLDTGISVDIVNSFNKTLVLVGSVVATGTANSLSANLPLTLSSLSNGIRIRVKAIHNNTTTTPTLSVDGLTPLVIVKGVNEELVAGDITTGSWCDFVYDSALNKWVLLNPNININTTINNTIINHVNETDPHTQYLTKTSANDTYQLKVDTDDERWEMIPKGNPQMLYPSLTSDMNLTTWLTNHPKWKQCDGSNGTPDLRGKFIIGSDTGLETTSITGSYTTTGGNKDAIVPYHTHTATDSGHTHSASRGAATQDYANGAGANKVYAESSESTGVGMANITVDFAGTQYNELNANLPPYYAMVYVVRTVD